MDGANTVRAPLTQEIDEKISDLKGRVRELLGKIDTINKRLLPIDDKSQTESQKESILIKTDGWLIEKVSQLSYLNGYLDQILEKVNKLYYKIDAGLVEKASKKEE